jgi:gliding motility-associated-like protein
MKKSIFTYLFIILITANCFAQFSKTHYIPPVSNSDAQEPQGQFMYISCPSITPIEFKIIEIGGTTTTGTVSRDNPYIYTIGTGFNTQFLVSRNDVNTIRNNKGFIVEAEDLIYVSVRMTTTPQNFQAGGIVSKGLAALGTQFRIGAFTNTTVPSTNENHYTFAAILATENNTTISFSDIKPGVSLINNAAVGNNPNNITLNSGESFVMAVQGPTAANRDGLIGALISSDKPIAVNCGSIAGSNGTTSNLDLGFDQIVSAERTGNEYIFIKGNGLDVMEKPIIIAHEDNTDVFLNGSTTPYITLNAGNYVALLGDQFSPNGNLYVNTSKNVFAYQGIGGSPDQPNQNMHFLPPLSCQTPKIINNIPFINVVGNDPSYTGTVNIVTETGATLDFIINGTNYTLASLPAGINANGPFPVVGNLNFETYTIFGFTGNVSVFSTNQLYLSFFGSSGAATYGGYYSGFTFKPEITLQQVSTTESTCIPNVNLSSSALSGFDTFQWYFNDAVIPGANAISYQPTQPGNYYLSATLSTCSITLNSDRIPVSNCAADGDNDGVNDNIDLDNDNDGITNCNESFGSQDIDLSATTGNLNISSYSNSFTNTLITSTTASSVPFVGATDGSFISEVPAGKQNFVTYTLNFASPISLGIEYVANANASDLVNSTAEYIISSPINKTITVLNQDNQLLIDTNYDGFYESGITQFSSFEIRFRLNSPNALAAGTGTFRFLTNLSESISFTHKNLTDNLANRSTFKIYAVCVPKDSDNDGIPDQLDYDSDNDSIPDFIEVQGSNFVPLSNSDTNNDGIDNAFGIGFTPTDSDGDAVTDYLDLDSDNDGIYDIIESGSPGNSTNTTGVGIGANVGINGLANNLETTVDSGVINYIIFDTDSDGILNFLDLDSDGDGCSDVTDAGFADSNADGLVGSDVPTVVNPFGIVTTTTGYLVPNNSYLFSAPIAITTQPQNSSVCELQSTSITIVTDTLIDSYQWELSIDNGVTWSNVINNTTYSGANLVTLAINNVSPAMTGYQYRVILNRIGNNCGLVSSPATLTTFALPTIVSPVTIVQCDIDTDGIASFNLTAKNNFISTNSAAETFTYFTSFAAADTNNNLNLIATPLDFVTANTPVWVRVENANSCHRVAQINLIVSVTQLPSTFVIPNKQKCDDFIDSTNNEYDGVASFDFTDVFNNIQTFLPPPTSNYTVKFYKTLSDFNTENDINGNSLAIADIANYRNVGFPNQQTIYVRVDSNLDNSCFGNKTFDVIVEPTPVFNTVGINNVIRQCDDNHDGILGFDISTLESDILQGQSNINISYFDNTGNPITLTNPFIIDTSRTITVRLNNNPSIAQDGPCFYEESIQFIVDDLPQIFPLAPNQLVFCDDEANPLNQDGFITIDTTNILPTILQGQTGLITTFTLENGTVLTNLPPQFTTGTQNVVITLTNPLNNNCSISSILNFVVNPLPNINLNTDGTDNQLVCTNLPTFFVTIDAGITDGGPSSNYTYQWYLDQTLLVGETNYSITVNTDGDYTVEVTNIFGCTRTRTINVKASDTASIQDIYISDLSDNNTVQINVTGSGDYVYTINDGIFQESNYFSNVPFGIHIVYIKDLNGCGVTQQEINVLGAPKYFTPNGDGYNDYWNIRGISESYQAKTIIHIFDRFGKLLKQIAPTGLGWDGTFNGNLSPSDDYWYTVTFEDGRTAKGNFALKR